MKIGYRIFGIDKTSYKDSSRKNPIYTMYDMNLFPELTEIYDTEEAAEAILIKKGKVSGLIFIIAKVFY